MAPLANSRSAWALVGVFTLIFWPARGWLEITRDFLRHGRQGRHALDGANQIDEIGDIVGTQIKDGAAAGFEEKIRIGVPMLHAETHDMGGARSDLANISIINCLAGPLMGATEESIRRAAHAHFLRIGCLLQGEAVFQRKHQWLLGIDMLARLRGSQ